MFNINLFKPRTIKRLKKINSEILFNSTSLDPLISFHQLQRALGPPLYHGETNAVRYEWQVSIDNKSYSIHDLHNVPGWYLSSCGKSDPKFTTAAMNKLHQFLLQME